MTPVSLLSVVLALGTLGVLPKSEALPNEGNVPEFCYAHDRHPYLGFGSKTSYEEVYNKAGITPLKGCKAVQMWMVIRHGTRYPGLEDIPDFEVSKKLKDQVIQNHKNKKGSLCDADLAALMTYNIKLDEAMANHLSLQGRKDLFNLGGRLRRSFPEIFGDNKYEPNKYQFRFTPTPRTQESAEYFFRGVFGLRFDEDAHPLPDPITERIYTYNDCPRWEAESAKNKFHRAAFSKTEHIKTVISGVSRRLGFEEDLSLEELKIIYNDCRYYEAWHVDDKSPWCAAFSTQELLTLEYMEDLNYYYKSGPGHPWNIRLSCPLVKDMYDHFSDKVSNIGEGYMPRALFYFSHATLLNQLSAGLGLKDDEDPITEDNFLQKSNRNFRTSNIIPFTANILAVLYKCKYGNPEQAATKVRFFQAEHLVQYPGCSNGICEWEYIKKKFDPYVNDHKCTDISFCKEKITKPESSKQMEMSTKEVKENFTSIIHKLKKPTPSTIGILSLIIVLLIIFGIKLLT